MSKRPHSDKQTNDIFNCDSLISFLNNVDIEEGWWYSFPIPGKKTFEEFDYVFLPISKIFSINKDDMNIYWYEIGCLKRHGKAMHFQSKGYEAIISQLLDDSLVELSITRISGIGDMRFMRIGSTCETPSII